MFKKSNQICRFIEKGKVCKYGDSCIFQHQLFASLPELQNQDHEGINNTTVTLLCESSDCLPPQDQKNPCHDGISPVTCGLDNPPRPPKNIKKCRFYFRFGRCQFGNDCKYTHYEYDNVESKFRYQRSEEIFEDNISGTHLDRRYALKQDQVQDHHDHHENTGCTETKRAPKDRRRICKYFVKNMYCRSGPNCAFKHTFDNKDDNGYSFEPGGDKTALEPSADGIGSESAVRKVTRSQTGIRSMTWIKSDLHGKKSKLCPYFKTGECWAGVKCRFRHPRDVMEDLTDDFQPSLNEGLVNSGTDNECVIASSVKR